MDDSAEVEIPEFLSTHPSHAARHEELTQQLPAAIAKRLECNCNKLEGPDPDTELARMLIVSGNKSRCKTDIWK